MKKLETLKPEHSKVLKRIQDSIPKEWMDNLTYKVPVAPNMKEACERALKDPKVGEAVKKKARILLDSGYLDKEMEVVNPHYEKKINNFIETEIAAAIRRGELLADKKNRNLDKTLKRIVKAKR